MLDLLRYECADGTVPIEQWLSKLRDRTAQARIRMRLTQLRAGNFGDCASVGEGVIELRIHIGAGHRVYCARYGHAIVLLLCGGDKLSQPTDIQRAKEFWKLWKRSV